MLSDLELTVSFRSVLNGKLVKQLLWKTETRKSPPITKLLFKTFCLLKSKTLIKGHHLPNLNC